MAPARVSRLMGKSAARTTFCAAPSAGRARISEGTIRCDVYNLRRAAIGAEVEGVGVAQGIQLFAGRGAAHAALAVEQQNLTLVLHAARKTGFNPVQGKIDGAGKMALVELGRGSDIDNQGAAFQVRLRVLERNLAPAGEQKQDHQDGQGNENGCPVHSSQGTLAGPARTGRLVWCARSLCQSHEKAKADSSLTTPKLNNVGGPVRSE